MDDIFDKARKAFSANSDMLRPDRFRITFKEGWVKVGRPFMVKSQKDEFVIWIEGGGVEDFKISDVQTIELLPPLE